MNTNRDFGGLDVVGIDFLGRDARWTRLVSCCIYSFSLSKWVWINEDVPKNLASKLSIRAKIIVPVLMLLVTVVTSHSILHVTNIQPKRNTYNWYTTRVATRYVRCSMMFNEYHDQCSQHVQWLNDHASDVVFFQNKTCWIHPESSKKTPNRTFLWRSHWGHWGLFLQVPPRSVVFQTQLLSLFFSPFAVQRTPISTDLLQFNQMTLLHFGNERGQLLLHIKLLCSQGMEGSSLPCKKLEYCQCNIWL